MICRHLRFFLLCILSISLLLPASQAQSTSALAKIEDIPKQIRSALGELRVSQTPVMMPTWLPDDCTGPLNVGEGPFKDGYEISLGTCSADTTFFTSAGKGMAIRTKRTVKLSDGTTAYVQNLKDFCMDWSVGPYCYRVGGSGYGTKADVAQLVRIANSMKRVPPRIMNAQPSGEDRLADHYRVQKEIAEAGVRAKIGQLYDSAIETASHGNYTKAESQLSELIKKWSDCYEMPPLAQAQMAMVHVLKKMNRTSEASVLEQHTLKSAYDLEAELKKDVTEEKKKFDLSAKDSHERSLARVSLSKARRKLGDLYLAEGRYEEAENLYKTAFVDVASIAGRQCYESRSIVGQYENLLRLWGRNPEAAKQFLRPKAAGHPPVRLELAPGMLIKNGSDKLFVVLEDEYGAPSGAGYWPTRKAWLQGEKGGAILWKKSIRLKDGVNMETAGIDVNRNTFTLWCTFPSSSTRQSEQRYLWDGSNLKCLSVRYPWYK